MFLEPNLLQELERAAERLIPVDDAAFCGLMAKEDVLAIDKSGISASS